MGRFVDNPMLLVAFMEWGEAIGETEPALPMAPAMRLGDRIRGAGMTCRRVD